MPGSGAVWKNDERYKARCLVGACARYTGWGQADALDCNCLNTTSQHRDKQSESTQTHRWCKSTQTNSQGAQFALHTQTNCTQVPLKRHLPAHSRGAYTHKYQYKLPSTKTQKYTDTQQSKTHKDALSGNTRAQAPVLIICLQQEGNALHGSRLEEYCRTLMFTAHLNNGVAGDHQE